MKFEELPEFIKYLFEETNNDQLWDIWKSNPFQEESYEDFKNRIMHKAVESTKTKSQVELEANIKKDNALSMLNKLGGDALGN